MNDQLLEKLISEFGVKPDIKFNTNYYQECVTCAQSFFNRNQKFNVLGCGHMICSECWERDNKCMYPNCSNKTAKHQNLVLDNISKNTNTSSKNFRFMIMLPRSNRGIEINLTLEAKLNDLVTSSVQRYIQGHQKYDYYLVINKKQVKLKEEINLKLSQICENHKIRLNEAGTNIVLLLERKNGGHL